MKTRWRAVLAGGLLATGCSRGTEIEDAWVRLPAVPGRPAAAYATIHGGNQPAVLTAIASPAARRIELHHSMATDHGAMTMRPIERLPIPSRKTVTLAPGGLHAMLFDLTGDLRPGGKVMLKFRLGSGDEIWVDAKLVGAGDPAP
ncbi:copper chaperone PCu(A)C [Sphingomonas sp. VNH70]|uniref:copper chaperone PCu(A)C n=1 Tax=Sphingomonas silueang TaxID=3156617 RepID=UPI0032B55D6C